MKFDRICVFRGGGGGKRGVRGVKTVKFGGSGVENSQIRGVGGQFFN